MDRLVLTTALCLLIPFVLFAQELPDVKKESKKPSFQPIQAQQGNESRRNAVILMPEINMITFLKSNDFDLRLDSMMRVYHYRPIDRENAPKEIAYAKEDSYFVSGYVLESKNLMLTLVIHDEKQYTEIRGQLVKTFKKVRDGKFGDFFTETYNMGRGLGTIQVGFSSDGRFLVLREIMIPNYFWNIDKYQ